MFSSFSGENMFPTQSKLGLQYKIAFTHPSALPIACSTGSFFTRANVFARKSAMLTMSSIPNLPVINQRWPLQQYQHKQPGFAQPKFCPLPSRHPFLPTERATEIQMRGGSEEGNF